MEAVPRLPMISFALKTSPEKTSFHAKLKDFIRNSYNEDPESFSGQIFQTEGLRASAVRPAHDVTGCNTMKRYYCQLHFLLSRFPLGKDGEAAVKFTWKDPYTDAIVSAADITLEMASILYNIGALHSQLGSAENRTVPEGMKMACSHFQCAAWAFQHIREEFPQILNYDASTDLLLFMNQVCLAQAQECLLEKSMMDNRKPSIVAKVAIQTAEYYKISLKLLNANSTDDASVSETISSKLCKKWEKYLKFKISYHGCIDMLYRGQQAEEEQKMGERVAYYQTAFEKLEEAKKLSKGLDNLDAVNEATQFTQDVVEGKKKAATNENEFIYHEEVPATNLLPEMKGASLVKGIGFSVNDPEVSGSDIFGRLIPLTAHETSSIYSEELAKLLRNTTSTILKREEELQNFLSTLQLDELKAREEWKLPQDLIDRCAAISAKPDAIEKLIESMNSLSDTYQDVEGMLSAIKTLLKKEEEAVLDYEEVVGKQPPSIAATDLTREANKYQDAHAKASESNQTLHQAMLLHIENLRLLSLPPRELREQIPVIAYDSPDDEAAMKEMQNLMNKVKEMKTQRGMLVGQFREAISNDDITHLVVTFTGEDKEQLFQQEMQKHHKQNKLIKQNLAAQDKILGAIQEVYPKYTYARRNVGDKLKRRDAMVASLKASYDAYEDLLAKSNKGLEFYSKLQTNVSKLYQRVKSTCKVLEEEREQILKKILHDVPKSSVPPRSREKPNNNLETSPLMPGDSMGRDTPPSDFHPLPPNKPSGGGGLKLKDYLNMKKETGKMSLVSGTVATGAAYGAGYAPVPSPHLYEPPAPSWIPSVRPAPVGSEGTDTPTPRVVDSDNTTAWNAYSQWNSSEMKGSRCIINNQPYANTGNQTIAQSYVYPTDETYLYQAQSFSQPTSYAPQPYVTGYPGSKATSPTVAAQLSAVATTSLPPSSLSGPVVSQTKGQYPEQNYSYYPQSSTTAVDSRSTYQGNLIYSGYNTSTAAGYGGLQHANSVGYSSNGQWPNMPSTSALKTESPFGNVQQVAYGIPAGSANATENQLTAGATNNHPASYDQQSSDGSYQAQRSSNTSLNSLGSMSSIKSQTSLTTAFSDPYVNEGALKSQSATDFTNYATTSVQQNITPYSYSSTYGTGGPATASYYPAGYTSTTYPQNMAGVDNSTTATYPSGYYAANMPAYSSNTAYTSGAVGASTPDSNFAPTVSGTAYQAPSIASNENMPGSGMAYQPQYIPQMGGGYQQASDYLQSGNASTYTSTLHGSNFTVTPSGAFSPPPKSLDLKQDIASSVANPYDSFIPQGAGNTPIQSPVTYKQAGFAGHSTVSSTYAVDAKSSPQVTSSNVDLLAGLEFDLPQTPLVPENPRNVKETPKDREPAVAPSSAPFKLSQDIKENYVLKREPEERKIDIESLKAFVPDVDKFEKFVEGLTVKTLNGPTPLEVKWKEIIDLQEKDIHSRSISVARCYSMKNRFPDILPYDDSRVELPSTKDDYINASLLKPITHGMPPIILTQSPLPVTYTDFWTMVLEQNVEVIVCLLADKELGGDIYWPTNKAHELELGKLKIVLQTCNVRPQCVERIFSVTSTDPNVSRVVVHLQFTAWPGSSFPPSPAPFLSFVAEASAYLMQQRNPNHPVVVHCHSGVGRTGLFCLILAAILDIGAGRGIPDIVSYTAFISRVRKNSLRDREHVRFAYQSVLYFCQDLLLRRGILTNKTTFEEKKKKEGKTHTRHPSEDFLVPSNTEQLENEKGKETSHNACDQRSRGSSKTSSGRTSPVQPLLAALDPNAFNLKDNKPGRSKPKFTPDSFTKAEVSLSNVAAGSEDDPLSSLDPLWSLKK